MVHDQRVQLLISSSGSKIIRCQLDLIESLLLIWCTRGGGSLLALRTADPILVFFCRTWGLIFLLLLFIQSPGWYICQIIQTDRPIIRRREEKLLLGCIWAWGRFRCEEFDTVDQLRVMAQFVEEFTCSQFPEDNLFVFSRAHNKPIAFAYVDLCNVVLMPMQWRLQR